MRIYANSCAYFIGFFVCTYPPYHSVVRAEYLCWGSIVDDDAMSVNPDQLIHTPTRTPSHPILHTHFVQWRRNKKTSTSNTRPQNYPIFNKTSTQPGQSVSVCPQWNACATHHGGHVCTRVRKICFYYRWKLRTSRKLRILFRERAQTHTPTERRTRGNKNNSCIL